MKNKDNAKRMIIVEDLKDEILRREQQEQNGHDTVQDSPAKNLEFQRSMSPTKDKTVRFESSQKKGALTSINLI